VQVPARGLFRESRDSGRKPPNNSKRVRTDYSSSFCYGSRMLHQSICVLVDRIFSSSSFNRNRRRKKRFFSILFKEIDEEALSQGVFYFIYFLKKKKNDNSNDNEIITDKKA